MFAYLYVCSVIILKCLPLKRNEKTNERNTFHNRFSKEMGMFRSPVSEAIPRMTCLGVQIGNEQHLAVLEAGIDERLGRAGRTVLATTTL